jgi:hypothetical protein
MPTEVWSGELEPLGRPRLRWDDKIQIYVQEVDGSVDWIDRDRYRQRAFVK